MKKVIYGFGISGKWAADQFDDVVAFVDTDIKKHCECYRGVTVSGPAFLRSIDDKTTEVIVSVVDIMDVLPLLDKYAFRIESLCHILLILICRS